MTEDRSGAELAKLKAEIELLEAQKLKARLELDNADLERAKLRAEALLAELQPEFIKAQTGKALRETYFYPLVAVTGVWIAVLGVAKLFGLLR